MKDYHGPVSLDGQCSHYPISRRGCANRIIWVMLSGLDGFQTFETACYPISFEAALH